MSEILYSFLLVFLINLVSYLIFSTASTKPSTPKLPAKLLRLCMGPEALEVMLGDMEENYQSDCKNFGAQWARIYYWQQTVLTLWESLKKWIGSQIPFINDIRRLLSRGGGE